MSDSSIHHQDGEFMLMFPTLKVYAPIALTDEEGEQLYKDIRPGLEDRLARIKRDIEDKFPNVRVGYDTT